MFEQLNHDDIVWEVPSRRVIHRGNKDGAHQNSSMRSPLHFDSQFYYIM